MDDVTWVEILFMLTRVDDVTLVETHLNHSKRRTS